MPRKLEIELSEALTNEAIENLLLICDKLHESVNVDGYTPKDLPSDEIYEQYSLKVGHVNPFSDVVKGSIMYMGSVYKPKPEDDIVIKNIVLTPKYDGTSLAIRFIKNNDLFIPVEAHTKGREIGGKHINQDVSDKIKYFIKSLSIKESKRVNFDFNNVSELHIRGEFICKDKQYDEDGNPSACHASLAAGQINRLFNEFKKDIEKYEFIGYEVAKVFRQNTEEIPTQKEAIKLLKSLYIEYNNTKTKSLLFSGKCWTAGNSANVDFPSVYEKVLEYETHPTDGIVYCSEDWKYPTDESAFKSKFYGKYAWKPQSEKHITVDHIEYSMAKDGDINFNIVYEPLLLNGKTYSKAKVGTNKLSALIKDGLGKGAVCNLELKNDVIPYVSGIVVKAEETFELPLSCPFCDKLLNYIYDKDEELRHVRCENENCGVLLITKWTKFISAMNSIYKKEHGEILETYNEKGKRVKTGIAEKTLTTIAETKRLNRETIESYMPTIFEEFEALNLETQLNVLGFGGKSVVKKIIEENGYKTLSDVESIWIYEV